jgi:predicted extracellular nuclease
MNARGSLLFGLLLVQLATACGEERRTGALIRRDFGEETDPDGGIITPADTGVAPPADTGVIPNRDAEVSADRPELDAGRGFPDATSPDAGMPATAISIRTLQDETAAGRPAVGALVRLQNVIVSAIQASGDSAGSFWVQESGGGPFSGILIFVPLERVGTFSVREGDILNITGIYAEYFDVTEIEYQEHEYVGSGSAPLPQEVDPADIANGGSLGEAFEGVLVRVSSVTVLSDNPDAPMDFGEFMLTSGLRIDDQLYRLSPRPLSGTFLTSITGVHHHSFANYKLLPRSASDYVY